LKTTRNLARIRAGHPKGWKRRVCTTVSLFTMSKIPFRIKHLQVCERVQVFSRY
jgi:hypothetical protein